MKKLLSLILALSLVFSFSITALADTSSDSQNMVRLSGSFGEPEAVRGYTNPFYLDAPVVNCRHVTLDIGVKQLAGICSGYYYLYVRDADGNWHHTATFRVKQDQVDGTHYSYDLDLDDSETFTAVAIWPADKGMDFTATYDYSVYVNSKYVSEFSSAVPKPRYEQANTDCASILRCLSITVKIRIPGRSGPSSRSSSPGLAPVPALCRLLPLLRGRKIPENQGGSDGAFR